MNTNFKLKQITELMEKYYTIYNDNNKEMTLNEKELLNALTDLMNIYQNNINDSSSMSPNEALKIMSDLGFSKKEMKEILKSQVGLNDKK